MAGPQRLPARDDLPPNNISTIRVAKKQEPVRPIRTGKVLRRKKTLTSGLTNAFFGSAMGGEDVIGSAILEVVVPALKDMLSEFITSTVEMVLFGERRGSRRASASKNPSIISYGKFFQNAASGAVENNYRERSSAGDDDEFLFTSLGEAEDTLDALSSDIERFHMVTVADLYELIGFEIKHTDVNWGWRSIAKAKIRPYHGGGYLLIMPRRERLYTNQ